MVDSTTEYRYLTYEETDELINRIAEMLGMEFAE